MPSSAVPGAPSSILVADTSQAFEVVRSTLGGRFPLVAAHTLEQARSQVAAATPLVLCGCHFDEGRMYELLRYMKARPALNTVPFLTIRVQEGELEDAMYESVKIATGALGGDGFIDLFRWQRLYGPVRAARQFAERVAALAQGTPGERDSA